MKMQTKRMFNGYSKHERLYGRLADRKYRVELQRREGNMSWWHAMQIHSYFQSNFQPMYIILWAHLEGESFSRDSRREIEEWQRHVYTRVRGSIPSKNHFSCEGPSGPCSSRPESLLSFWSADYPLALSWNKIETATLAREYSVR